MEKKKVRILLDIWAGPIWECTYEEDNGEYDYYIEKIAKYKYLMKLHQEIQDEETDRVKNL